MNNRVIWKFFVPIEDMFTIEMPVGAEVLSVQSQLRGGESAQLWALCDPEAPKKPRQFFLLGTGHGAGGRRLGKFVGTFQLLGGDFVGHLFEEGS